MHDNHPFQFPFFMSNSMKRMDTLENDGVRKLGVGSMVNNPLILFVGGRLGVFIWRLTSLLAEASIHIDT